MRLLIFIVIVVVGVVVMTFLHKSETVKKEEKHVELPYMKRQYLMSNAEREFFKVLHLAVQDKYYIVPQVQLSKIVQVEKGNWHHEFRNKINLKSVDFVLFDKEYFTPQIVIELDDLSHERLDRMERDVFVDSVMQKIRLKIVHVKKADTYDILELLRQ